MNKRPSVLESLNTRENDWGPPRILTGICPDSIAQTTRDNDASSEAATRCCNTSTLTHMSNRELSSQVLTKHNCRPLTSSNVTEYSPKATSRDSNNLNTRGNSARLISACRQQEYINNSKRTSI